MFELNMVFLVYMRRCLSKVSAVRIGHASCQPHSEIIKKKKACGMENFISYLAR
jgi:hypothetical protein